MKKKQKKLKNTCKMRKIAIYNFLLGGIVTKNNWTIHEFMLN